jgi:hypothetical protein
MIPKLIWIGAAWLLLPTGDPTDLLLAPIIVYLGFPLYLILVAVVLWILWHVLRGKNIKEKFKDLLKKLGGK